MKLVFFTRHQELGASSRYRSLQYFALLQGMGYTIDHHYFFSDAYLQARSRGEVPATEVLKRYWTRLKAALTAARDADAIIIEKELFPFLPAATERLLRRGRAPVIYDYDDAIWHAYERRRFGPLGAIFKDKIKHVVAGADHVVAGSHYLFDQVAEWGAPQVSLIPTTVPAARYQGQGLRAEKSTDIVWIGSMSTGPHVQRLFPVLEKLHLQRGSITRLIGFSRSLIDGPVPDFVEIEPWSAATELDLMASGRIGIMPLPDEPFERGKCAFKLVQYMGIGLPCVASPVGENSFAIQEGETGFLAQDEATWLDRLNKLLDDPALAKSMAQAGHARYLDTYSTEAAAEKLDQVIRQSVATKQMGAGAPKMQKS